MKYMVSWYERSQGSPIEYENAQKRILEIFSQWEAPDNFNIELFVVRVGEWGGSQLWRLEELEVGSPFRGQRFDQSGRRSRRCPGWGW